MVNFAKQTWYNKNDAENKDNRIPINAYHLNRIEEGIDGVYKRADELEAAIPAIAPYLAFVGNANANMVAAAFGEGNETESIAIGKALKMYARFKGDTGNLDFLDGYNNYTDLILYNKQELVSNQTLYTLISSSTYANNLLKDTVSGLPDIVLYDSGETDYLNISGATVTCDKTNYKSSFSFSNNFTGNVLNISASSYNRDYGSSESYPAANCIIPISKPLPDLRGYRYLWVKFSDGVTSGFTGINMASSGYGADVSVVVAGATLKIPSTSKDLYLTGESKVAEVFSSYANNPTQDNIKIQLNMSVYPEYSQNVFVNIEKIWISEI